MPQITKAPRREPLLTRTDEPRASRADEVKGQRRRRTHFGLRSHLRFSVPDELRDDNNYVYRWVVDRPGRIEQLTVHDDYDFVVKDEIKDDPRQTGGGTRIERHAGTDQNGQPMRAYLVRKPKDYYVKDKAAEQADLSKRMAAIKRGRTPDEQGKSISDDGMYVPRGGIVIQENDT